MPLVEKRIPWLSDAAVILCALMVIMGPLALGAVHPRVVVVFASVALVALLLHLAHRLLTVGHVWISLWIMPIMLGLTVTAFQLLPLPHFLRALLSSGATERIDFVSAALSPESQAWVLPVLSQDPPETSAAFCRLFIAFVLFLVVSDKARSRRTRSLLSKAITLGAILLVLTTLVHTVLRLDEMYGFVLSTRRMTITIAPLINPNHLARAFGVYAVFCLAQSVSMRDRKEKGINIVVGLSCAALLFLCGSHGGVLALTFTLMCLFVFARGEAKEKPTQKKKAKKVLGLRTLLLSVAGLLVLALCLVFFRELLGQILSDSSTLTSTSKLSLYGPSLRLALDNALVGTGNSAFRSALPSSLALGELWQGRVATHPENIVLQVLTDHGLFFGATLLIVGLYFSVPLLVQLVRGARPPLEILVVVFLITGELFDFSMEVGFGLWLCTFAWAICAARLSRVKKGQARRALRLQPLPSLVVAGLIIVVAAGAAFIAAKDDRFSQQRAIDRYRAQRPAPTAETLFDPDPLYRAMLERSIARHPHDGHFAFLLSSYARETRDIKLALAWANRSMLLWPNHPGPHAEAARALASLGYRDQALMEYRLAWTAGQKGLIKEVALRFKSADERVRALPENDPRAFDEHCRQLQRERRNEDAIGCLDSLAEMAKSHPGAPADATVRAIDLTLRNNDAQGARRRLYTLVSSEKERSDLAVLFARLIQLEQGPAQALKESGLWFSTSRMPTELIEWRLMTAIRAQEFNEASQMLSLIKHRSMTATLRARVESLEASLLVRTGKKADALRLLRTLTRKRSNDVPSLRQLAMLEYEFDLKKDLEKTLLKLRTINKQDPTVLKIEALRAPKPPPKLDVAPEK